MKIKTILASILIVLLASTGLAQAKDKSLFKKIVVFGESTSDIGNTWTLTGRKLWDQSTWMPDPENVDNPYLRFGFETLPTEPVPPLYDNGRWSNGAMWVETLSKLLGVRGRMTPSLDGGLNYAFTDARTGNGPNMRFSVWTGDPILDESGYPIFPVPGIGDQIRMHADAKGSINKDHLVVLWIGANDIIASIISGDDTVLVDAVADIQDHIVELVNLGAKHILVPNQIDASSAPLFAGEDAPPPELISKATNTFNGLLACMLEPLNRDIGEDVALYQIDFSAVGASLSDPNNPPFNDPPASLVYLESILTGPEPLEIDDPSFDYLVFWDTIHPTAGVHSILANAAADYFLKNPIPTASCPHSLSSE